MSNTDVHSPEIRSYNMSKIRGKNTKPEIRVRSLLHQAGFRFRLHDKSLPGKPDIILPRYKTVIFVNGCFWHRHTGCKYASLPKSKIDFWKNKFDLNMKRDRQVSEELKKMNWRQLIIWECEIKNPDKVQKKIKEFFNEI